MRDIIEIKSAHIIKELLDIDNVYNTIAYDGSPSLEEYTPTGVWFILCEDGETAGFIKLDLLNNVLWTPHIYIFEQFRGEGSEEWGIQVAHYMKQKYGAKKFLAFTPYEAAKKYAERIGFKDLGVLKASIKKNGQVLDQYLLELSV